MEHRDSPFSVTDWAALQRQYLDTLQTLGFPGVPGVKPGTPSWQQALDYWWQQAGATLPVEQKSLVAELVRQSGVLHSCAEFFLPLTSALAQKSAAGPEWQSQLRQQFLLLQQQLAAGQPPPGMESLLGAWKLPDEWWQQTSTLFARLPNAVLTPGPGAASWNRGRTGSAEALQQGTQLWQNYQQALAEYSRLVSGSAKRALEELQRNLLTGTRVQTLRELYDLWVECGESAFSELMAGTEFAAAFARLVNALSAFKLHTRQMLDAGLEALNLPTAQALQTMQQREAGMRGELRDALTRQQEDRETLLRLQDELKTLRRASTKKASGEGGKE